MADEYKIFKSVEKRPLDNSIWEDNQMETLINNWVEEGYDVDVITTHTSVAGDFLMIETTVALVKSDDSSLYGDYDYDDEDEDETDGEDDENFDDEDDVVANDEDEDDKPRHRW